MTVNKLKTVQELDEAAKNFSEAKKELKTLKAKYAKLSDSIIASLQDDEIGLGQKTAEGNYSAKLPDGSVVIAEKKTRYDPIEDKTIPFFGNKGLMDKLTKTVIDRDETNAAIRDGVLTEDEVKDNFDKQEIYSVKVVS